MLLGLGPTGASNKAFLYKDLGFCNYNFFFNELFCSFNSGNLYPEGLQAAVHPYHLQHEEHQDIEEEEVQIKANDIYHLPKVFSSTFARESLILFIGQGIKKSIA